MEKRKGSANRIVPSLIWDAGINTENFKPIAIAGMLKTKLVRGPATPVSKIAFRDERGPSIRMTAPNVPKGERGKGRKKGNVALMPCLRDMK